MNFSDSNHNSANHVPISENAVIQVFEPADTWPDPLPLSETLEPEPYPLDALPNTVRTAVNEVLGFVKSPVPLVASSAIAALSLSIQPHIDVKRAEKLTGPIGVYLLTFADSGERKSTSDNFFSQELRKFDARQAEIVKPLIKDHAAALVAWEAKCGGIKEKIRQLAKTGKTTFEQEEMLRKLEHKKPEPPRVPRLIYVDTTPESLKWDLAKKWPSGGVISSEAGLVFGSHGMIGDSTMRNLATLNQLWDGAEITTERRSSESFTVRGVRLTMSLQVQRATFQIFMDKTGGLARGSGFFARFLVAVPDSTQGSRPFTEAPEAWPALDIFDKRIAEILGWEIFIGEDGSLNPLIVPLSPDAKAAWVVFHDAIESELRAGGELHNVRDFASKTADNAVRLAALFQVFEHGIGSSIGSEAFEGGSRIAAWHLNEARRFLGEMALSEELVDAVRLDKWLVSFCRIQNTNVVARRDIQRNVTPVRLRKKMALDAALVELVEAERVRIVHDHKRKEIHINPALLEEGIE